VVLKKTVVEIDGVTSLIIMIRDVSDKVQFDQELLKKKVKKERTFNLQNNLDEIF